MTDSKQTEPENPEGTDDKAEATFWAKLDERIDAAIDRGVQKYARPGTSRNGGRTTLPGILANIMFGPEKSETK